MANSVWHIDLSYSFAFLHMLCCHLLSVICYSLFAMCLLPFTIPICHLLSAIRYLLSAIGYLLFAICHPLPSLKAAKNFTQQATGTAHAAAAIEHTDHGAKATTAHATTQHATESAAT